MKWMCCYGDDERNKVGWGEGGGVICASDVRI